MSPARPEIKEVDKDEEQHCQPGEDQRNYGGDRISDRTNEELPIEFSYLCCRGVGSKQQPSMSRIPPHDVDEDAYHSQDPAVEGSGNGFTHPAMERFGEYSSWKRQKCDEHQVEDVQQQQRSIHANDVVEHGVVVDPDGTDHQEADRVSEVERPELEKCCPKHRIGWRHFDFEYQQGDGDREDGVAECFQSGSIHAHPSIPISGMPYRSRSGTSHRI